MISAQVMAYDKSFAMYWLGLNAEKMPNLGQGELLQWEAILKAKSAGCITYDLCYIEKERLPKIYEFKKGFSQFEVPVHLVRIRPYSFRLFKKAFSLISNRSSHEQLI
jgi:lipid II:glycine glycyltransferase (peptidoglycan interpeptide bridge formation enzyme)